MSPRKTRLVVDLVRGLSIADARAQLQFSKKAAAKPVLKVLNSAVANAENNHSQDTSAFFVTTAFVDEGPTIKRYRPRAHGRSAPIRKRMSHITIVVGPKDEPASEPKKEEKKPEAKKAAKPAVKKAKAPAAKKTAKKPAAKKAAPKSKKSE